MMRKIRVKLGLGDGSSVPGAKRKAEGKTMELSPCHSSRRLRCYKFRVYFWLIGEGESIHELAVTENILKIVLEYAQKNEARQVISIDIRVGELRDFLEDWMQWYFDHLSENTIAAGGKLNVKRSPTTFKCDQCEETFAVDLLQQELLCPSCGSGQVELISGREFYIESIGVV